jgi:hypothetical protein
MFYCKECDYTAKNSSNFANHRKTEKHKNNFDKKSINEEEYTSESTSVHNQSTLMYTKMYTQNAVNNYICSKCGFSTTHKSSYYRHNKMCDKKGNDTELMLKLELLEKEKEMIKKVEEEKIEMYKKIDQEKSQIIKEKTELLNSFMANANHIINKAQDNTKITAQAMQTVSVSALKYANDKFKETPVLVPIENFNINNLSFDNESDRKQLTEILIYNAKQKSLDKLLGNHIVKCYKKENPEEQSFHTTDCSRLNYIVRDLLENALTWSVDKNGIKICSSIIKPLIEKCIEILLEHQKDLIEEMAQGNYQNKETVQTIISVLMSIDKGGLESDINKYIAPFFNLNKILN